MVLENLIVLVEKNIHNCIFTLILNIIKINVIIAYKCVSDILICFYLVISYFNL